MRWFEKVFFVIAGYFCILAVVFVTYATYMVYQEAMVEAGYMTCTRT